MTAPLGYTVELPDQGEPQIGQELIRITHEDGRTEELRLHNYARVYALPGLYEQIVHERLGCRSPDEIASMLAETIDQLGWERRSVRVIDLAAGNGVSGEALKAHGLHPVLGTDIVPEAREAALRDRPNLYDHYLTLDLLFLSHDQQQAIQDLEANVVSCVAPVGTASQQLPPQALTAVARLLACDAVIAYMHDPTFGVPDEMTPELWGRELGPAARVTQLQRRRYLHRHTLTGKPYEMIGMVWRVQRA